MSREGEEVIVTVRFIAEGEEAVMDAVAGARAALVDYLGVQADMSQATIRVVATQKEGSDALSVVASATTTLGGETEELSGIMDIASKKGASLAESMLGVEAGMTAGAMAATAAAKAIEVFIKVAIAAANAAGDFEFQMARVRIVGEDLSRGLAMDMEELGDAVLDTMTESIFSMKDITNVMFEFAAAGKFTSTEIAEATEAIKNLAQATGYIGDLGRVAENTAAIMNIYGNQVKDVAEVTDVMAKVANDSVMTIEDIGVAMQYVGPIGVMAGQTFEEIAAALTVLSNQGLQASQAGRYLRQVFTYFAGRTPQSARAMRQLGLEVIDAEGNFRDLGDIVADLTVGLEGLTEQEQVNLLTRAFGVWGSQAMSALVNAERAAADAADEHAASLSDVKEGINEEGFAAQRAEELLATYEGRKKQLINTAKELTIQLGEKMLEPLTEVMEKLIAITEEESFIQFVEDLAVAFEYLAKAIGFAVDRLETFILFMGISRVGGEMVVKAMEEQISSGETIEGGVDVRETLKEPQEEGGGWNIVPLEPPGGNQSTVINQNTISVYGDSSGTTGVADEILMALTYSLGGRG